MRTHRVLVACVAVLCVLPAVHPGDIQWVGDEPMLIAGAMRANGHHAVATHGLTGTAGATYGPFPIWLYQAYLWVSSNLVVLVALRALVMTVVLAVSLLWISRTLGLWPWFIPALLCSPYLWFYARALWDNTFNLPLCALAFASGVSFLARARSWTLLLALGCCVAMLLTHLMALALVVPLTLYLLVRARARLRQLWWQLTLLAGAGLALSFPYLSVLRRSVSEESGTPPVSGGWTFPFLGGRILSAQRIADIFGAEWLAHDTGAWGRLAGVAGTVSLIAFALVWAGVGVAVVTARDGLRSPTDDTRRLRGEAALLALLILLGQVLLDGLTSKAGFTHYFNATWIVFAFLAWLAVDALHVPPLRTIVAAALAVSTLTVALYLLVRIHHGGPARMPYGATLANQLQVARELNRYGPGTTLRVEVINVLRFPIALAVLRALSPAPQPPLDVGSLRLEYVTDDPVDGRIRLVRN
ncbi:MAG TPA: hypothetical protein VFN91_17875 [Myxococcaceae bacterium]|nr:hypothetical protein [Myxococcaceae bacterium]